MIWSGYGLTPSLFTQLAPITSSIGDRVLSTTTVSTRRAPPSDPTAAPATLPTRFITDQTLVSKFMQAAPVLTARMTPDMAALVSNVKPASATSESTLSPLMALYGGQRGPGPQLPGTTAGAGDEPYRLKQECVTAGGRWDIDGCVLPGGEKVTIGADGKIKCLNAVGACAPKAPATGGKMGPALMIGGAALAALLLLR